MLRSSARTPSTTSRRNRAGPNGTELFTYGKFTFNLPPVLPPSATPNDKFQCLQTTTQVVQRSATHDDARLGALVARFGKAGTVARTHAENSLEGFWRFDDDSRNPDFGNAAVWRMSEGMLVRSDGAIQHMNAAGLTHPQRQAGYFLAFKLTVDVAALTTDFTGPAREFRAGFALPRDANGVAPYLNTAALRNVRAAYNTVALNTGANPLVGTLKAGVPLCEVKVDLLRTDLEGYAKQVLYQLFLPRLRTTYAGRADSSQLELAVQGVRQRRYDPSVSRWVSMSVEETHQDFMAKVSALPQNVVYSFDLATAFYNSLSDPIKEKLSLRGHGPQARPVPDTNAAAADRVETLKDHAVAIERESVATRKELGWGARAAAHAVIPAMVGVPQAPVLQAPADLWDGYADDAAMGGGGVFLQQPNPSGIPTPVTQATTQANEDVKAVLAVATDWPPQDLDGAMAYVFSSVAEDAIRRAKGLPAEGDVRCWGCNGPHRWRQCPDRDNPTYVANFKKRVKEWQDERAARLSGSSPSATAATAVVANPGAFMTARRNQLETEWKREGFPSLEQAQLLLTAVDPQTTPVVRASVLQAIRTKSARSSRSGAPTPGGQQRSGRSRGGDDGADDGTLPILSLLVEPNGDIKSFETTVQKLDAQLRITTQLMHIKIPVSTVKGVLLEVLVDPGAGVNVGRLEYHRAISQRYPNLVHQFANLADVADASEFAIGGIGEGSNNGVQCTAVIAYKMPVVVNGKQPVVSFALGENVACNSLVSLPFLKAIGANLLLPSNTIVVDLFGETFTLDYKAPARSTEPPLVSDGEPVVLSGRAGDGETRGDEAFSSTELCDRLSNTNRLIATKVKDFRARAGLATPSSDGPSESTSSTKTGDKRSGGQRSPEIIQAMVATPVPGHQTAALIPGFLPSTRAQAPVVREPDDSGGQPSWLKPQSKWGPPVKLKADDHQDTTTRGNKRKAVAFVAAPNQPQEDVTVEATASQPQEEVTTSAAGVREDSSTEESKDEPESQAMQYFRHVHGLPPPSRTSRTGTSEISASVAIGRSRPAPANSSRPNQASPTVTARDQSSSSSESDGDISLPPNASSNNDESAQASDASDDPWGQIDSETRERCYPESDATPRCFSDSE